MIQTASKYKPGIYTDIAFDEYRQIPAMNASTLKHGLRSMAHLKDAIDHPREVKSDALAFGTALHTRILEPDTWRERIAVAPKVDRRTKAGKAEWEAFCESASGKTIIDEQQAADIDAMASMVDIDHSLWLPEVTVIWRDEETGVLCKGRLDLYNPADSAILDIKTAICASPSGASKAIERYNYDLPAAMYVDGVQANTGCNCSFHFAFLEKKPPFASGTYPLGIPTIRAGHERYKRLLRMMVQCEKEGHWPGYASREINAGDHYIERAYDGNEEIDDDVLEAAESF